MQVFRHLLAQRRLALLICVAALLLKLLVPSGYMVDSDHGRPLIGICSGTGPAMMSIPIPGLKGNVADHGAPGHHGKAEMPCPFSGLSAAMTGAIDPLHLAGLVAFVMAIGLEGVHLPSPYAPTHLRPPLRGPPLGL